MVHGTWRAYARFLSQLLARNKDIQYIPSTP